MALLSVRYFSEALELSTSMQVILPQRTTAQIGMAGAARDAAHPVLYLLHGLSDDDTIWLRRTSIERYAADLGLAVVMPAVHRSFYTDEAYGLRHWTHLTRELPSLVSSFFDISQRREDTFVAGLSMGGYGAMTWALRQPERFAAAASLSGALDVAELARSGEHEPLLRRIYGDAGPEGGDGDLFALLSRTDADALPRLYVSCGIEDVLLPHSRRFASALRQAGVTPVEREVPGDHEWAVWDAEIARVLQWLPLAHA